MLVAVAVNSVSDFFINSSHPGIVFCKISGSFNASQTFCFSKFIWYDPEILKQSIPGCEEFKKNSNTEFTATATNKIGPFNASFTGDIELKDLNPPHSYKITGSGNSPVGFANGEATVSLEDEDNGTKLTYTVEANVGGKIAQVGSRLIDMTAKKMADIFFGKFSELVSNDQGDKKTIKENVEKIEVPTEKKSQNKTLIYVSILLFAAVLIYLISWIA